MPSLRQFVLDEARRLGFQRVGVCAATASPERQRFRDWLDAGYHGQMKYLEDRRAAYEDPDSVLAGVRSIVMLAIDYATAMPAWNRLASDEVRGEGFGRVSRYAWGETDYHDLIHARLKQLKRSVLAERPEAQVRGVVDTAPLLERDYARLAGLGWIGKNTMLIDRDAGSWFFLAALLTDLSLEPDPPFATDHCGSCRACLDACPTDAFPEPYVLDATRCISYLTIELREAPPRSLRPGMGEWAFGCDVCQDVCPWNRKPALTSEPEFAPREDLNPIRLRELFSLDETGFRERFRRTPLWRSKRAGILRNAAIVLGNQADPGSLDALRSGLRDESEMVRSCSAWALGRLADAGVSAAAETLQDRLASETSPDVLAEIRGALRPSSSEDRPV